jgi:hypothetical protein
MRCRISIFSREFFGFLENSQWEIVSSAVLKKLRRLLAICQSSWKEKTLKKNRKRRTKRILSRAQESSTRSRPLFFQMELTARKWWRKPVNHPVYTYSF